MGRCNNRRAQERAVQDRNTPSRARFSKGPPKKNIGHSGRGGRCGGRGHVGRDGQGRGGRAANESVVQKLQDRGKAQTADIGGISVVKKQSAGSTAASVKRKRHPLDGIDVSKLDHIALSPESVTIVERLLRAYNVWAGDESEEKKSEEQFDAFEMSEALEEGETAVTDIGSEQKSAHEVKDIERIDDGLEEHHFALLHGDDSYDDYTGDYEDEPDFHNNMDIEEMINEQSNLRRSELDKMSEDIESIEEEQEQEDGPGSKLVETTLFKHLTQHYSFQQRVVIHAIMASHKRLALLKKNESKLQDAAAAAAAAAENDDEGVLLEMAMDWLSLHLEESDLRRGFIVQTPSNVAATKSFLHSKGLHDHPGLKKTIKAVPHDSISIMPKLTETQYRKESVEAMCQWKRQELCSELVRIGFHKAEVEAAISSLKTKLDKHFSATCDDDNNEGSSSLQPISILDGAVFKILVDRVESTNAGQSETEINADREMELKEASLVERDQEKEVLDAIYAEDFQLLHESESSSHYQIVINANDLEAPARNDMCCLHIITRPSYPLASSPSVWFANPTLPPSLQRRISIRLQSKAKELIGQPVAYDLVEFLVENISCWQRDYSDEQAEIEKSAPNVTDKEFEEDEDEIDFYTTTFTAEERKNLSRRQRQKLRAAERSYVRNEVLLEKQRQKEQKDEERRARIRFEDSTITSRRAEQVVEQRWKEWVGEEAEKAARKAMNDAFLRDESRYEARAAADAAREEVLKFHGEAIDDDEAIIVDSPVAQQDEARDREDVIKPATQSTKMPVVSDNVAPDVAPVIFAASRGVTEKTLAFTEKLRRMYEQKAAEKAAGIGKSSKEDLRTIRLTGATLDITSQMKQSASTHHIPAPVVTTSPCMENILDDILSVQKDQPWLVQPDARVPSLSNQCDVDTSQDMSSKQDRLNNLMRLELERKCNSSKGQGRYGRRNKRSSRNKFDEMLSGRSKLPAFKMRNLIVDTIRSNQIVVISGDTGCGKTTQVPQLVLDDLILSNQGARVNIIVTQPRRISAIGVSERIAAERCERIGETAGYSIRLESKRSSKTRLLLCTTGVLLRRLQVDPDLASVSHVFVDEVHERDLNTDFLLIILKDLLQRRSKLKLVLMSATLNAETFSSWFGGCPVVSIPGRAQPVQEYRLEDALQVTNYLILEDHDCAKKKSSKPGDNSETSLSKTSLRRMYPKEKYGKNVIDSLAIVDETIVNYDLIAKLLQYICTSLEEGAILVFLPGFREIQTAMEAIGKLDFFRDSNTVIYPLHSTLSSSEQTAIFQRPPDGKRKVVLATNIAETSITIDDVVFVIDTGRVKENRYDDLNKMPTLTECWVSKASAKQRRGRAGRVKPGYCWHLYSTHTHDKELVDYQLPEMLRVGLEDLVLQILVLDLGEPAAFLRKAVNPPTELSIRNALNLLESLGAAECDWEGSQGLTSPHADSANDVSTSLTALGYNLATLPVHPRVGKMMIYGALFGVYDSCLTMAAAMTSRSPFISSFNNRDAVDEAKRSFASDDHISILLAFNQWRYLRQRDGRKARAFLRENFLSFSSLNNIVQLRKQLEKYMIDIGFSAPSGSFGHISTDSNEMHLVRAVIAAGLYPNIIIAPKSFPGTAGEAVFRGEKGDVYLHPCTVAYSSKELDSRYCCYHEIVKTSKVYVRDCTSVSKFSILLFGGSLKIYQSHGVASVDSWLKFRIQAKPATLVKYLRSSMETLLLQKIMDPEVDVNASQKGKAVIDAVSALLKMESVQH